MALRWTMEDVPTPLHTTWVANGFGVHLDALQTAVTLAFGAVGDDT